MLKEKISIGRQFEDKDKNDRPHPEATSALGLLFCSLSLPFFDADSPSLVFRSLRCRSKSGDDFSVR